MGGEDLHPPLDEAGRHGLSAYVHQSPMREVVVGKFYLAAVYRVEDILRPRHEQPDYGHLLVTDRAEYPSRGDAFKEHRAAAAHQRAEPMHLGARVIERRDAEEDILSRLRVVFLFGDRGAHERLVAVQYRLREAGGTAREIDGGVVLVVVGHGGLFRGLGCGEQLIALRECRAVLADEQHPFHLFELAEHALQPAYELLAEHQDGDIRKVEAVLDLALGVAVV